MDKTFELYLDGRDENMVNSPDKKMVNDWARGAAAFYERCLALGISDMCEAAEWCHRRHRQNFKRKGEVAIVKNLESVMYLLPQYQKSQLTMTWDVCNKCFGWPCRCED